MKTKKGLINMKEFAKRIQNTRPQHTPTPWYEYTDSETKIQGKDGKEIAVVNEKADAAFIVRAVNCHEELVTLLKEILRDSKTETENGGKTTIDEEAVERLIAKAEGKERV